MRLFSNDRKVIPVRDEPIKELEIAGTDHQRFFKVWVGQIYPVKDQPHDIIIESIEFNKEQYLEYGDRCFTIYANVGGEISPWKDEWCSKDDRFSVKYSLEF